MKENRIFAFLLAVAVFILSFPISTVGTTDSDITMLHYENYSKSENALIQLVSGEIMPDTSYTLSFKYHFDSASFVTSGAGVYVGIFGHDTTVDSPSKRYGNHFLRMNTSRYTTSQFPKLKSFASVNVEEYDATYNFSLSADDLQNMSDIYAGFYFVGSSSAGTTFDMYICDMTLYKTSDTQKNNLLSHSDIQSDLDGWYSSQKAGNSIEGAESLPCNTSLFYPRKTMFHYARNLNDENYINQKINSELNADISYTVYFDYHFADNSDSFATSGAGLYVGIFGHDTTSPSSKIGGNTYLRMSGTRFTNNAASYPRVSAFTSSNIDNTSATFTFTLSSNDFTNISKFYLSFYQVKANIDIYIANLTLYRTDDSDKINLLSCDEYTNDLSNWYTFSSSGNSLSSYASYMDYSEVYFPKTKKMIHYKNYTEGSYETSFIEKVSSPLKPDTLYTISMKYNMEHGKIVASNGAGAYIGLFGHDTTKSSPNNRYGNTFIRMTGTRFKSQYPNMKDFIYSDISDSEITLIFSLSQEELNNIDTFYVGFYFVNPKIELYFSDLTLYESSDTEKTNLLCNDEYADSLSDFYDCYKSGKDLSNVAEIVKYDSSKMEKTMLHVTTENTISNDTTLLQNVSGTLEANKEYTFSFDYRFNSGIFDRDSLCVMLLGYDGSHGRNWDKALFASKNWFGDDVLFTTVSYKKQQATYTFTLTDDQVNQYSKFLVGFYFLKHSGMTLDFYVSDVSLYLSSDPDKSNLLSSSRGQTQADIWCNDYNTAVSATSYSLEYLPYDSSYFNADAHARKGDTNRDYVLNIIDLIRLKKQIAGSCDINLNADVDGDYFINSGDIVLLKKHLLGVETVEWEFSLMKTEQMSGGYDRETELRKQEIFGLADSAHTGTVYYVSENDPDAKIHSISELNAKSLKSGDAVLFKRGEIFRTNTSLNLVSGVFYGAYGNGAKPVVSGSLRNYADASLWHTSDGVIWKTTVSGADDAGNITFNDGIYCGVRKLTADDLLFDGDYYIDPQNGEVSLCMHNCNPGAYFNSIEIASTDILFLGIGKSSYSRVNNITIENLEFKNAATCAVNTRYTDNLSVSGCEFFWIGGSYFNNTTTRYGNALEMYHHAKNCSIKNNTFYQIYDSAITFQGPKNSEYSNIEITGNIIEYSSLNFEFWSSNADQTTQTNLINGINFCNNILRFGGYGFGGFQREYTPDQSFVLGFHTKYTSDQLKDFDITGNVFDVANSYFFYVTESLPLLNISGNAYFQKQGSYFRIICGVDSFAHDQASFEAAIANVDNKATVTWLS